MKRTLGYVLVAGFMFGTLFAQEKPVKPTYKVGSACDKEDMVGVANGIVVICKSSKWEEIKSGGGGASEKTASLPDAPPVVSGEIRASYWKAVHELDLAQAAGVQAQALVQAAVNEGIKVCGEKYVLGIDPEKQDLTCIVKPVAKATPLPAVK